ncbi:DUF6292 family protein [Amycolatopsis thermophila]|uniref:DUF6292 domain-containing protein n=1 Tax=Amycolatopsis thermophila TaxID=206084 RepID=A0ABU0F0X9_9PSEU|nr:DUF6292 family protein [Amycolatopsis thermophila]MDQ0381230.1 hypothetical protein [Amycolatopsis thermophila]
MKPDPDHARQVALRSYVERVARALGVEASATWCEYDDPSAAYVALADLSAEHPGRALMLDWTSTGGWRLAVEPTAGEDPIVLEAWPEPVAPEPAPLAALVRHALTPRRRPCAH